MNNNLVRVLREWAEEVFFALEHLGTRAPKDAVDFIVELFEMLAQTGIELDKTCEGSVPDCCKEPTLEDCKRNVDSTFRSIFS